MPANNKGKRGQSLKSNVRFVTPEEKGIIIPKGAENPKERSNS